jgi:hypothetical protein
LAKIIGGISSDLYPTSGTMSANWIEAAGRWTAELKAWRNSLPAFLNSDMVEPSMLIPIFQRQSTVLKLAYAHALILANRQSLLSNFADLSRRQNESPPNIQASLKECIKAAMLAVETVNNFIEEGKMSKAFWFTHYISFCAIATVYVYTIQRSLPGEPVNAQSGDYLPEVNHLEQFQAAEKCQRGILNTTAKNSPFRRYNIILDELKKEVLLHLGRTQAFPAVLREPAARGNAIAEMPRGSTLMDSSGNITAEISNSMARYPSQYHVADASAIKPLAQDYNEGHAATDVGASSMPSIELFDDTALDLGLFGSQGELVGWSEFDSYVGILL